MTTTATPGEPTRDLRARHATHEVSNQPPPLAGHNLYDSDAALREAVVREGAGWAEDELRAFGELAGRPETIDLGRLADRPGARRRSVGAR